MLNAQTITEKLLPDYRRRHIFITKLRLLAFVGFWAIFLFFLRDVLDQTKLFAVIVFLCFFSTGYAYYNIIRERLLLFSFALELISDLTAITVVVYLTGGPHSPYFTIYLFYVLLAGAIYNHFLAAFVATISIIFYGVFLLLCEWSIIPPPIFDYGESLPIPAYTPIAHFVFALIFIIVVVYTVKVAIYFSQERERSLEKRNRELMALHSVSQSVKSVKDLSTVIKRILSGVVEGLGFETVVLVHFDKEKKKGTVHTLGDHEKLHEIESAVGQKLDRIEFKIDGISSPAINEIMNQRLIFRRSLSEMVEGLDGFPDRDQCDVIQKRMGFRRIIAVPLVVEENSIGALVGFSKDPFLESEQVATLESFANHAAISLEAASLINTLKQVNAALKEANKVKSEFLATMSHELRTPLTAIIGFSELMIEGLMGEINEEQSDSLKEVLCNAAELLELINSLLDMTKIESGRMWLDLVDFNIEVTINRVASMIAPLVNRRNQHLTVEISKSVPAVRGDEKKLQQVILNLLANANKFTGDDGTIAVTGKYFIDLQELRSNVDRLDALADVECSDGDDWLLIQVSDNGIGIPPEHQERIFEMFHQADSSVTRSFGGTGLGLSLARKFVELHGGAIWVTSNPGEGASFKIALPVTCQKKSIA